MAVDSYSAALKLVCYFVSELWGFCPDGCGESKFTIVGPSDGFFDVVIGDDGKDRAELLFLYEGMIVVDVRR